MSGRPKSEQGAEKREHRTVIRWTKTEKERLNLAKEKLGLRFDVDVIRHFTLEGVERTLSRRANNVAE